MTQSETSSLDSLSSNGTSISIQLDHASDLPCGTPPYLAANSNSKHVVVAVPAAIALDHECDEPHKLAKAITDLVADNVAGGMAVERRERMEHTVYEWVCDLREAAAKRDHDS
jgi:hypothetical protein